MTTMKTPSFGWERLEQVFYRNRIICKSAVYNQEKTNDTISAINYDLIAFYLQDAKRVECYNHKKELSFSIDMPNLENVIKLDFTMDHFYVVTNTLIRVINSISPLSYHDYLFNTLLHNPVGEPDEHTETEEIWDFKNNYILSNHTQSIYMFTGTDFVQIVANNERYTLLTKRHWDAQVQGVLLLSTHDVQYYSSVTGKLETMDKDAMWEKCQIAPSSSFVYLYNEKSNELKIFNLTTKRDTVSIQLSFHPSDIKWCGNDAVACLNTEDDEINVYGPSGKYVTFWYPGNDESFKIKMETTDSGLKVYSSDSLSLISKVATSCSSIFKMGSTSSSAILFDALQLLNSGFAPRAIKNLQNIDLVECVGECIDAALEEFDPNWQKKLLTAASFGKSSIMKDNDDEVVISLSHKFVNACNTIRFLNNLTGVIGYQLTIGEYETLGFEKILNHLLQSGNLFNESLKLCAFFPNQATNYKLKVMHSYTLNKIIKSNDQTDEELYHDIISKFDKLELTDDFQFSKFSEICYKEGRLELSKKMVLQDSNIANQIKPLLDLEEDVLPLQKAHASGSHVLELYVLLKLQKKLTNAQLFRLMAVNLDVDNNVLIEYYHKFPDYGLSFDFYKQIDDYENLTNLIMEKNKSHKEMVLDQVDELYKRDASLKAQFKQYSSRELDLIHFQKELESKFSIENVYDLTCHETLKVLVRINQSKLITKFIKKFSIDDKAYYSIKADVLIEQENFDKLWEMCNERRFNNNIKQIFKKIKRAGFPSEAGRYVHLMKNEPYEGKMNLYLECQDYNSAINMAIQAGDHDSLIQISELTVDKNMKKFIQDQLVKL